MAKSDTGQTRRRELIDATILAIGDRGNLDVTMSEIAGRAGVSAALAHHYFKGKDDLLLATMRQQLTDLIVEMAKALGRAKTPRERVSQVVRVNFSAGQFRAETITAWLAFYVEAQRSPQLRRLLRVYVQRLHTNLLSGLRPLMPPAEAEMTADGIGALIDGFYIRRALRDGLPNPASVIAVIEDYIDAKLMCAGLPS